MLCVALRVKCFPNIDFGRKAWHKGTVILKGLLWDTQLDMSPGGSHWYRSASSPVLRSMQICPLQTLSIVLETGFHLCIWLSFRLLLLRESDQCLLPKWPGKERETGTNYILMRSQRLLHVHLDSTQFGRLSARHTHSMKQERLVIPSQISQSEAGPVH